MKDFKAALASYLGLELDLEGLEAALLAELRSRPDAGAEILLFLEQLYQTGRITHQVYAVLRRLVVSGPPAGTGNGQPDVTPSGVGDARTTFRRTDHGGGTGAADHQSPGVGQVPRPTGPGPATGGTGSSQWPGTSGTSGAPGTGSPSGIGTSSSWRSTGESSGPPIDTGSIVDKKYVLESLLGQGGMGSVYKARDLDAEQAQDRNPYYAMKVLNEEFKRHRDSYQALQRESKKAQGLSHDNIVKVHYFGRDKDVGTVYMVMELLEGETLDKFIRRHPQGIPVQDALPIVRGLAAGLQYAHVEGNKGKGIVHSDFKPGNAFLTNDGTTKIFDFGIARAAKRRSEVSGDKTLFDAGTLGALTPSYASLEMLNGEEPDPRDDIYALALITYELLTGRHPFDRQSALEARKKKLVPSPVKGLSRRQWAGLLRALAFTREGRTHSAAAFLAEIEPLRIPSWVLYGVPVVVVLLAGLLFTVVPRVIEDRRLERLTETITGGADEQIAAALGDLQELDPRLRTELFANVRSKDAFIGFYERRIRGAFDVPGQRYDYPRAEALLGELRSYFPDSDRVAKLQAEVEKQRIDKIPELYKARDRDMASGLLIPEQGPNNVVSVLEILRRISPDDPALNDQGIPIMFAKAAQDALQTGNTQLASLLVDRGLRLAPNDTALINLKDRVVAESERMQQAGRIRAAEASLAERLPQLTTLASFAGAESQMRNLGRLDPGNSVLSAAQQRLGAELTAELDRLLAANRFGEARALFGQYTALLPPASAAAINDQLATFSNTFRQRIDGLLADLNRASKAGRLSPPGPDNAEALLESLRLAGADEQTLTDARGLVAAGYLERAVQARDSGQWDEARALVNSGLAQRPAPSVLTRLNVERDNIDSFQKAAQEGSIAKEQAAEIRRLAASFEQGLSQPDFDLVRARALADTLRQLQSKGAPVADGAERIVGRLLAQMDVLKKNNQWDAALELMRRSNELFPGLPRLQAALQALEAANQARLAADQDKVMADALAGINSYLRASKFDRAGDSQLAAELQKVEGLLTRRNPELRDRIATAYVEQAKTLRAQQRIENASSALDQAARYSPTLASLATEREALERTRTEQKADLAQDEKRAEIERLKQSLRAEARTGNVEGATRILTDLSGRLPADDSFLRQDGPRSIADAYIVLADNAARGQRFDAALGLLAKALERVPAYRAALEARKRIEVQQASAVPEPPTVPAPDYARKLDEVRRALSASGPLDEAAVFASLTEIRLKDPDLYARSETTLVTAVAESLARLSELDRSQAEQKVVLVRRLFPGKTILLPSAPQPAQVTQPVVTEKPSADPCGNSEIVGGGRDLRKGCRDVLPGGGVGPAMVVVPKGGPLQAPLAIGRYEISIREFSAFCEQAKACAPPNASKPLLPVTGISAQQAVEFARWLTRQTGAEYRLPRAEEWVYAATAAGQQPGRNFNCKVGEEGALIKGQYLTEVTNGDANGWGLKNYVGNAQELVQAGGGWEARGGSRNDRDCGIENRVAHSGQPDPATGFRLVRELKGKP